MRTAIIVLMLALGGGLAGCGGSSDAGPHADAEAAAVASAEAWLALVDGGKYGESWDEAAKYFQGAVGRTQWEAMIPKVREPLGANVSRELISKSYQTALPGAPDGEYVVIQYKSSFANKKEAVETITPQLDEDGRWRVCGYYIK